MVKKPDNTNPNHFIFIDDQTKKVNNIIIYMIFDTFVLHGLSDYFLDTHTNNVIFIKENHTLSDNLIQEIKEYEHLIEYGEYDKV
tara:strand:- start:718 stop:972 length:255 start_codon:yes stop_codon:yes gene_type:complete